MALAHGQMWDVLASLLQNLSQWVFDPHFARLIKAQLAEPFEALLTECIASALNTEEEGGVRERAIHVFLNAATHLVKRLARAMGRSGGLSTVVATLMSEAPKRSAPMSFRDVGVPFSGHQIVEDQLKRIVDAVGIANNILR